MADDAAASALAGSIARGESPGVDEISKELYDLQKKKLSSNSPDSTERPQNLQPSQLPNVAPVGNNGYPVVTNSTENITPVTLMTGQATPPHESLLEQPAVRRTRGPK